MNTTIHGYCEESFTALRDAFEANFADGLETGACMAVTHLGRMVADLWAGHCDKDRTTVWERDTVVPVASTTKFMTVIAFLILIDRGLVDINEPVADYWPEFAAGGMQAVTVRDALTHQAGVPGFCPPIANDVLCNWPAVTQRLAQEPHWFGGERQICYHLHTFGFLLGEIIRRVDGRRPRQFFHEEVCRKAGLDFQIGLGAPGELARIAPPQIGAGVFDLFEREESFKRRFHSIDMSAASGWERLSLENPGGNGYGNARAIAGAGAILANGGTFNGVRVLSPQTIALAGQEHAYGPCPYLGWIRFGLGFGLHSDHFPMPGPQFMGWGGFGGSMALADPASGVSFSYAPNNWAPPVRVGGQLTLMDPRNMRFFEALAQVCAGLKGQA